MIGWRALLSRASFSPCSLPCLKAAILASSAIVGVLLPHAGTTQLPDSAIDQVTPASHVVRATSIAAAALPTFGAVEVLDSPHNRVT